MKDSLKDAVDKQLAIAKLEEKLHIHIGETDTPEAKLKSILKIIRAVNAQFLLKALFNMTMPFNVAAEILQDENASEEKQTKAKEAITFHMGGPIVKDITESLMLITDIFDEQKEDND